MDCPWHPAGLSLPGRQLQAGQGLELTPPELWLKRTLEMGATNRFNGISRRAGLPADTIELFGSPHLEGQLEPELRTSQGYGGSSLQSLEELRSLRMSVRYDQFSMLHTRQLSRFTGLTSLHLTLHANVLVDRLLHMQLCKLSRTLQDLYLATPQGEPQPADDYLEPVGLELLVPLPHLTRLCLGRCFAKAALDFDQMPQLRRLQLRTFRRITGAATLSRCTKLSELEVFGSAAKKILPAAPAASLRHLVLHYAPGAEKHCPAALTAFTALRCLALRGKQSASLLPTEPLPSLRALFLEDSNVQQLFHGTAKIYSQLRVLHLAGVTAGDLTGILHSTSKGLVEQVRQEGVCESVDGLAMHYHWMEALLLLGPGTGQECPICPHDNAGKAAKVSHRHLQLPQHEQQLALFKLFRRTFKESVAFPLALSGKLQGEYEGLIARGVRAGRVPRAAATWKQLTARLVAPKQVVETLADLERRRAWSELPALLDVVTDLWSELFYVAKQLQAVRPAFSLGSLANATKIEWAEALARADSRVRSIYGLASQQAAFVLPGLLVELGLAVEKPYRKSIGSAGTSKEQEQLQQAAAKAIADLCPAGASVVTASFEGWVRIARALGL
ncbi:hypothetical protein N2152v2_000158 [Parachlorella kessleri]